jgi:hypothetical protein
MPLSAPPAKDGLKKALRLISTRLPPLRSPVGIRLPHLPLPRALAAGATDAAEATAPLSLEDVLSIPVPATNAEDEAADAAIAKGQFLARQELWEDAEARIIAADTARDATPGGTPIADLLAYGARADVVNAVEHALSEGLPLTERVTLDGIMSLERMRLECARTPVMSTVVAMAHLDISWACRRAARRKVNRQRSAILSRAEAHQSRARALLEQLPDEAAQQPFVAAARCALYSAGGAAEPRQIADDYIDLIRLDPCNPRHQRALGTHLAEQGTHGLSALELEARRVAALVQDHWGAAGYAWVYFDALAQSDAACLGVDVAFFLDGIADIVARAPSQDRINLMSAYCSIALKPRPDSPPAAGQVRAQIAEAAHWLIRDHLRELHPMIWAHASAGFDNDAPVRSLRQFAERGRMDALRAIADLFRDEIEAGYRVVFTADGPEVTPG